MAWIRLIEDYGSHKAGEKVDFPAVLARQLCKEHKAVCGELLNAPWKDYEKATQSYSSRDIVSDMSKMVESQPTNPKIEETKETVYPNKFKPTNGTVKEIKAYLDKQGIKYKPNAKKSDLIKLL